MDWKYLFFSFEGRISRRTYWIALAVVIAVNFALLGAAAQLLGVSYESLLEGTKTGSAINLAVTLLLLWPSLAYMSKRLHDRNRPGIWAAVLYALVILADIVDIAGLGGTADEPSALVLAILAPVLIIGLWLFVELGFLKGTQGPNEYGPDPLGETQADASY